MNLGQAVQVVAVVPVVGKDGGRAERVSDGLIWPPGGNLDGWGGVLL